MKNFIVFLANFSCLSIVCIHTSPLKGGMSVTKAKPNEFPFVVSIAEAPATLTSHHICGGTLISEKHILTARHCFINMTTNQPLRNLTDMKVTVGSIDNTIGRKYSIQFWIGYDDWASLNAIPLEPIFHDVAIVRLTEDVDGVAPAHISQCNHKQIRGRDAVTAGWGILDNGVHPKLLHKASLHVISRKKCRFNFVSNEAPPYTVINHVCTIHRPPVILGCGDSGGPLLIHGNQVIGINTGVCLNDIEHPNEQNGHQSIEYYRTFIEIFGKEKAPCPPKYPHFHQ